MLKQLNYISENGNIELQVSEDLFSAYLIIKDKGIISENDIISLIEQAGIKSGLDCIDNYEDSIKYFNEPFLIARCPIENEITINYLFDTDNSFHPERTKSLSEFNKIVKVNKDDPLATIELNKTDDNEQYYDIFGNSVAEDDIKERFAVKYVGDRVRYSIKESKFLARKRGYPYIDEKGRILVKSDFEFTENLYKTELNFYGNLIINGDIDNSYINVAGDLTIRGNIRNCLNRWVLAEGKLEFDSAENSFIGSGKQIVSKKSSRFCLMVSDGKIKGGKESNIIGGLVKSSGDIEVNNIGSSAPISTRIEITVLPFLKERLKKITNGIIKNKKRNKKNIFELNQLIKKQKAIEYLLEKAYMQLIKTENSPEIVIKNILFKSTHLKFYNKSISIVKNYQKIEVLLDKEGIIINQS